MLYFAADIHLQNLGAKSERFGNWLRQAQATDSVYLLGDILDIWLGDDDPSPVGARLIAELRALSDNGTQVYYQHGNRDFLVGAEFAARSGCQLIADEHLIEHREQRILLMHGDTLCTDDSAYQKLRGQLRDPAWQRQFLSRSLAERQQLARSIEASSADAKASKEAAIMDVNPDAVLAALQRHRAHILIHGHTHRPAQQRIQGTECQRWVLGYWSDTGSFGQSYCLE